MASLYLESDLDNFSLVICKNPESGMICSSVKKGVMFGYFSSKNRYNVFFSDGHDEMSFPKRKNQQFEYIDNTRYNSPLFVLAAIKDLFITPLNKALESDACGNHTLCITSCEIKKAHMLERINEYFSDFDVSLQKIEHESISEEYDCHYNNYKVMLTTTKTLHELLNFAYLIMHFVIATNHIDFDLGKDISAKLVKAANVIKAPYYVKYLIKRFFIKDKEVFSSLRDELNFDEEHEIFFKSLSNMNARIASVSNNIMPDKSLLDFGCGEGSFMSLAKKVKKYYAFDKDASRLEIVKKKAARFKLDNVVVLNEFSGLEEEYVAVLSEVIEHNEIEEAKQILRNFISDRNRKKNNSQQRLQ